MAKNKVNEDELLQFESVVDSALRRSNCLCRCAICLAEAEDDGRGGIGDGHCHDFQTLCFVPVPSFRRPRNYFSAHRRP